MNNNDFGNTKLIWKIYVKKIIDIATFKCYNSSRLLEGNILPIEKTAEHGR